MLDTPIRELKSEWVNSVRKLVKLWKFYKGMNYNDYLDENDVEDMLREVKESVLEIERC